MTRRSLLALGLFLGFVLGPLLGLLPAGCSPPSSENSPSSDAGSGAHAGGGGTAGGTAGGGGAFGSGGRTGAGGGLASGGMMASGGAMAAGGAMATGGATAAGGDSGTGGTTTEVRRDGSVRTDGPTAGAGGGPTDDSGAGGRMRDGGTSPPTDVAPDGTIDSRPDVRAIVDTRPATTSDATTSDGAPCPHAGHVTYTLAKSSNPTSTEQNAYDLITTAMNKAAYYYNCYTDITKSLNVSYAASVQTADGNINGSIRFGGTQYMEYITAMHEIAHTVGVGTASNWKSFVAIPAGGSSGPWTGSNANAELRAITGNATDTLTADTQHFWPYGLNYTSEVKSEADVIDHCRIVVALRKDLGMQ